MQSKNRVTAGVLALLLGGLGIHKFYLGQVGWGVLYLLFVWTGIPSVVGFIEGIIYLTVSDNQFVEMITSRSSGISLKFIFLGLFGSLLVIAAVVYLVITSIQSTVQDFYTVEELRTKGNRVIGKNLRISGATLGDTIQFDPQTLTLSFVIVNIPNGAGNTEAALNDRNAARINVIYIGPTPTLLKHGSQVMVTGKLGEDGIFYADELLVDWRNP